MHTKTHCIQASPDSSKHLSRTLKSSSPVIPPGSDLPNKKSSNKDFTFPAVSNVSQQLGCIGNVCALVMLKCELDMLQACNQLTANIFRHVGNSSARCVIRQWNGFKFLTELPF
ncbi:hypothetical protein RF11_10221 [Thelohanellus kitauei]|uniref:Uncharacterized protein n=1 Tax=Thelohanellus kitauei TaxID=669202 RepID=A0A0C2IWC3_THEKT|nr:hypothetical protein RF11_10221 [Thelohanellus kitauei]